jgi:hypothetical protein
VIVRYFWVVSTDFFLLFLARFTYSIFFLFGTLTPLKTPIASAKKGLYLQPDFTSVFGGLEQASSQGFELFFAKMFRALVVVDPNS